MTSIDFRVFAEQLGLWRGTNWMLTAFPAWLILLMPLIIALGLFVVGRMIELSKLKLHKQYKGFWPGLLFVSLGIGLLVVGLVFHATPVISPMWRSTAWNVMTILAMAILVGGLTIIEFYLAVKYRKGRYRPSHVYSLAQIFSPTYIATRLGMAALVYLFMKVGMVALSTSAVPVGYKIAGLFGVLTWMLLVAFADNRPAGRPDLSDVHPTSGGWFGLPRYKRPTVDLSATRPGRGSFYDESPLHRNDDTGAFRPVGTPRFTGQDDDTRQDLLGGNEAPSYTPPPIPPRAARPPVGEQTANLPPFGGARDSDWPGQGRRTIRRDDGPGEGTVMLPPFKP